MKNLLLTLAALIFLSVSVSGQGTVRGKITDENGEAVIGAAVVIKDQPGIGTITDFDGNFSLYVENEGPTALQISSLSFQKQEKTVQPKDNQVSIMNVILLSSSYSINEVIIESKANRSGDFYMERIKQNSATSIDYISSEIISRIGDRDVTSAMKRVSGVSTIGSFVTVRGLADRYIKTTVNGSRIPTLDPFTNNISLDLFPTGLVDNLVITKTASPDLPGDWSGAYLSIETKDFPDKLTVEVSSSFGYNSQSTFEDMIATERSSTDWLGYDNGFRAIPDGVGRTQSDFPRPNSNPGFYDQFAYLGIIQELNARGVVQTTPITTGSDIHRFGLVELGLLGASQFYNDPAFNQAVSEYQQLYPANVFFEHYNRDLSNIGMAFNNTWINTRRKAPVNVSQNITIGNQTQLFNRTLGFLVGVRYSSKTNYDPNSVVNRTSVSPGFKPSDGNPLPAANELELRQETSQETNGWNALAKLSYKLNNNNSVSMLFMPNFIGENNARTYEGRTANNSLFEILYGDDQFYVERNQLIYQLKSEHYIPGRQAKIEFNTSYTNGQRKVLDFKETRYIYDVNDSIFFFQPEFSPDRRYRFLDEDLLDSRISLEFPLESLSARKAKIKTGGAFQRNTRQTSQVLYVLNGLGGSVIEGDPSESFAQERFDITGRSTFDLSYSNASTELDNDLGFSNISAAFAMIDLNILPRLRFVGGARVEQTDMLTDIRDYYDQNLPADDSLRRNIGGVTANPGEIKSMDILPSANFIYKIVQNESQPINLRFNYFGSLARPGFRELSAVSLFDYELRGRVAGNPGLEMVKIQNFDLRLEAYFKKGDNASVSVFYKEFKNHIELIRLAGGNDFTWQNADQSNCLGLEFEGKKSLPLGFDIRGNVSFIKSRTEIGGPIPVSRQMFGQAPYIVNTMLTYTADSLRFLVSASYNVQGPKIAAVVAAGTDIPLIIEVPQHILDINATKFFGKHISMSFRVRNLLNSPVRRSYDFNEGYLIDFDRYTWGTEYNLSLAYKL